MAVAVAPQQVIPMPEPVPVQRVIRKAATRKQIEQEAYYIWIEEGRPSGREMDHWLAAERRLKGTA